MKNKKQWLVLGPTALITALLFVGCSHADKKQEKQVAAPVATVPQNTATAPAAESKPSRVEGELIVITATVKAIDKKNRVVTVKFPDGKEKKITCGPEVRNFPQIRIGDEVKAQFLESVELMVGDPGVKPSVDRETKAARAPLGEKPGFAAVDAVEVTATVQAIDYETRDVTLLGPEGKTIKLKAGPEVKRLNDVKQGDTVVARLTKAVSLTVSKPAKQ
jgi:Cu/Ag efflux protein CusF